MKLLIVESPTKTKTISKYIADPSYTIKASVGHIRDLPKSNKKAIDIERGFIPHYEISKGKEKVVSELKKLARRADEILLATDPDREGEAIAWHIVEALGLQGDPRVKRVVFNEITKEAVLEALKHPRAIDDKLRRAQEARRVLDRLVGYDLSGLIWKKVRYGLSAGRVQSPALRILMEREREIRAFVPTVYWTITGTFQTERATSFEAVCSKEPTDETEKNAIVQTAKAAPSWRVKDIAATATRRAPRPPFTTSTLQQAASSRLGFSPSRTMQVAQRLYEAGHITYMRTDATTLSRDALGQIYAVIEKTYGKELVAPRTYKTRVKNAQEAHEAIRPTVMSKKTAGTTPEQKKLYELIRARTIASQMKDAEIRRTKLSINTNQDSVPDFVVKGTQVISPGWLLADPAARGEDVELPDVTVGETLILRNIEAERKETQPPPRYTEAGLIKELEKRGIGRPSTYATIMRTLVDRGYVERRGRTLYPTDTGDVVSTFLENHFSRYISDTFTAEMENELDEIAAGVRQYRKTLEDFYTPFSDELQAKSDIPKITTLGNAPEQYPCPVCGGPMVYKLSRTGRFMSCAKFPECHGARTADGKELEAPQEIGKPCPQCKDGKLVQREGRFGMFISCSNYPKCKYIEESEDEKKRRATGVECPACKQGEMVERSGRFGTFYSCSRYPACKHAIKARPTGRTCTYVREETGTPCGALMMEGTKTIPERCSDKTCPNHNPHKLNK